ncbi:MAG TPA: UDP-N-acetylglucosamine 2-epimerase (non-hydrolyzing) [Candidatus Bathyarchaeia archaeon]|nr:UDP-N-acetylglucosamine 2-epimerase (non-hydrolyzing) [Candidatus Bathyarchaeia archaeon]
MQVLHVVGARPNFMKAAPVMTALATRGLSQTLVHTGQHYDANMSDVFFRELDMPAPDVNLEVGSGSHAVQTAEVMVRLERVLLDRRPNWVVVYGDVNSTMAATLVCAKLGMPVAHVEAGLRSWDRSMPEEINRLVTDQLADLLFTPSADGDENLAREGVGKQKIHLVGNVMIDTLVRLLPVAQQREGPNTLSRWRGERYTLVTLHRPSNVDDPPRLGEILRVLAELSAESPVLFPMHPRTRKQIERLGLAAPTDRLQFLEPLGYMEFLALQSRAALVITDSGGIQEETTFLGVPCLTVRENTERPITVSVGTNVLVGGDVDKLRMEARRVLRGGAKVGAIPPLWDGKASERIAGILASTG